MERKKSFIFREKSLFLEVKPGPDPQVTGCALKAENIVLKVVKLLKVCSAKIVSERG